MTPKSCAVIGSGIGGLAVAIRLAAKGYSVSVYEKNFSPGGKASQLIINNFRFDTGPSLLTMPFVLGDLFSDSGENIQNYLQIEKLKITCKYFYDDGTILNAFSEKDDFILEAASKTTEQKENIKNLLNYSKNIYDLTADLFLFNSIHQLKNIFDKKYLRALLRLHQIDTNRAMHEANSAFLSDPKIIQLFDRYATYSGSNPYTAPATLNIIQHVENTIGAYYCTTGIYSIIDALYRLALKLGVIFHFGTNVTEILCSDIKVKGITASSEKIDYDFVISNSDVNFTYQKLLKDFSSFQSKIYKNLEPSSSAIVFYWGVEGVHPELEIHNILFSRDYKQEFGEIFNLGKIPLDPTIYIYISSKFNKADAPSNHENWFVMINAPSNKNINANDIDSLRNTLVEKIKSTLKIDLSNKIISENILTPENIEANTNSTRGSIYGISSNSKYAAFIRQPNRSSRYKGLYFVGGSANPGGGIPLVLLSAKFAAESIIKHERF